MIDRSHIGHTSEPFQFEIEKGRLKSFAEAIDERNSIFFSENDAKEQGYRSVVVPPTFAWSIQLSMPSNFGLLEIDISHILHGEQTFKYHKPMFAGDCVTVVRRIDDIYDKKNGALEFLVERTEFVNQLSELCVESVSVTVIRNEA